jgi:2,4-dienoyl-CoA reductase-like NADH-dependent reductase (Old Yellow Enzyme family)
MRLILEIAGAVRAALPSRIEMGARLSASEWVEGGFSTDEAVEVARALKRAGAVYVCASSGGNAAKAQVPLAPGYQVAFAERIRREAGIATRAVGLIDSPEQAESIVAEGRARCWPTRAGRGARPRRSARSLRRRSNISAQPRR